MALQLSPAQWYCCKHTWQKQCSPVKRRTSFAPHCLQQPARQVQMHTWVTCSSTRRSGSASSVLSDPLTADGPASATKPGLPHQSRAAALSLVVGALALCSCADPAAAELLRAEPANALSLPTWAIHVSSVTEWVTAMALMWKYADTTGNQRWKGMTWGMLPLLAGALSACTYHFFYNSPDLDVLVALQGFFTVLGNFTIWAAAYRIFADSPSRPSQS